MLVHLRLTVPTELSDDVVDLLLDEDRSANLTVNRAPRCPRSGT